MTRRPVKNTAASVHQRLLNSARETGRPFHELLQYYAMERFLYRLSRSSHADKFVLKGALMLTAWQAPFSRPTRDIDLLGRLENSIDAVVRVVRDVCTEQVEPDGTAFDTSSVRGDRITERAGYQGVRVRFQGHLGTARISMQLDVGFGDVVVPSATPTQYPTILDLPRPVLNGYSMESAVAEKLQTIVRLGEINSRMGDFYDIWLLSGQFDFDGETLADAITQTFAKRGTEIPAEPLAFTDGFAQDTTKQAQWTAFLRRSRLENAPADFRQILDAIAAFVGPIASSLSRGKAFTGNWPAPGLWR